MINYGTNLNWFYQDESCVFYVEDNGNRIRCKVSSEAIDDHYGDSANDDERLAKAKEHFDEIIDLIGDKIGRNLFEEDGTILLRTGDW